MRERGRIELLNMGAFVNSKSAWKQAGTSEGNRGEREKERREREGELQTSNKLATRLVQDASA